MEGGRFAGGAAYLFQRVKGGDPDIWGTVTFQKKNGREKKGRRRKKDAMKYNAERDSQIANRGVQSKKTPTEEEERDGNKLDWERRGPRGKRT